METMLSELQVFVFSSLDKIEILIMKPLPDVRFFVTTFLDK